MPELFNIDHKYIAFSAIAVSATVAVYSTYRLIRERRKQATESVYETEKLASEYLLFHYGTSSEILRWPFGPKDSLHFPKRCAELCLKHVNSQTPSQKRALDIGCAVGRSSFELSREIEEVIGLDYSKAFVNIGNHLKKEGSLNYSITEEGDLCTELVAKVDKAIDRGRTRFLQGDACNLPSDLGQFDCVLAANLICRLQTPYSFLRRLASLVAPGGILVLTSPFTFLEQFTPKDNWLGGYISKDGEKVMAMKSIGKELSSHFDLIELQDMPFFIRETARKNQWTVAYASVWRRRRN